MSEHQQERIDQALREALAAPVPRLSADFDRKLEKRLRSGRLSSGARLALTIYVLAALVGTIWAVRSVPLEWLAMGFAVLVPASFAWALHRVERRPSSES
jgi:hypothetical protein